MNDLELLVAEIRKNLETADKTQAFIRTTEAKELAAVGKTPATALMMAGMIENYYTCLETLFLRIAKF